MVRVSNRTEVIVSSCLTHLEDLMKRILFTTGNLFSEQLIHQMSRTFCFVSTNFVTWVRL